MVDEHQYNKQKAETSRLFAHSCLYQNKNLSKQSKTLFFFNIYFNSNYSFKQWSESESIIIIFAVAIHLVIQPFIVFSLISLSRLLSVCITIFMNE